MSVEELKKDELLGLKNLYYTKSLHRKTVCQNGVMFHHIAIDDVSDPALILKKRLVGGNWFFLIGFF